MGSAWVESEGFRVSGTLVRCKGKLLHDIFYASPPGDYTVYIESLRPQSDFDLTSRETGIIGLEYALGSNTRALHGQFGVLKTTGRGGDAKTHALSSNWLNIDDRIGYVVCRGGGATNVMRHHDYRGGSGRVPKLQEWISLVGDARPALRARMVAALDARVRESRAAGPAPEKPIDRERMELLRELHYVK